MKLHAIAAILFLAAVAIQSQAQEADRVEIRELPSMKFKLIKPKDFEKAKAYPVLISLHGDVPEKPIKDKPSPQGDSAFGYSSKFEETHPAFVIVPRATRPWWSDSERNNLIFDIKDYIDKKLSKEFNIDKSRIYLVGYSDGGTGILHALSWYPNYFAAAIPMSGWLDWKIDPGKMARSKTSVWWFAGKSDGIAPWDNTQRIIKEVQKATGRLKVTAIENGDHGSPINAFNEACAGKQPGKAEVIMTEGRQEPWKEQNPMEWLFAQKLGRP